MISMFYKKNNTQYIRFVLILILLICIISSCTYFYFWGESNYPSIRYITLHPEEFDNTTIIIAGEIIGITPPTQINIISSNSSNENNDASWILTAESDDIKLRISASVKQFNIHPKKGDVIQCKGIYYKDRSIDAIELHILDKTLYGLIFIRSFAAVPIFIAIFILY